MSSVIIKQLLHLSLLPQWPFDDHPLQIIIFQRGICWTCHNKRYMMQNETYSDTYIWHWKTQYKCKPDGCNYSIFKGICKIIISTPISVKFTQKLKNDITIICLQTKMIQPKYICLLRNIPGLSYSIPLTTDNGFNVSREASDVHKAWSVRKQTMITKYTMYLVQTVLFCLFVL